MATDSTIFAFLVAFFLILGAVLPYIQDEFGQDQITNNAENIRNELAGETDNLSDTNFLDVIFSIVSMFFFTFGSVPFVIDFFLLLPLRIIMYWLLVRLVRGVG